MDICETVKLRKAENSRLQDVAMFVSSLYVKACTVNVCTSRRFSVSQISEEIKTVNENVAKAAFKKFAGHFWYLSEELVALAFFNKNVA